MIWLLLSLAVAEEFHVVRKGETLSSIAERLGAPEDQHAPRLGPPTAPWWRPRSRSSAAPLARRGPPLLLAPRALLGQGLRIDQVDEQQVAGPDRLEQQRRVQRALGLLAPLSGQLAQHRQGHPEGGDAGA